MNTYLKDRFDAQWQVSDMDQLDTSIDVAANANSVADVLLANK